MYEITRVLRIELISSHSLVNNVVLTAPALTKLIIPIAIAKHPGGKKLEKASCSKLPKISLSDSIMKTRDKLANDIEFIASPSSEAVNTIF